MKTAHVLAGAIGALLTATAAHAQLRTTQYGEVLDTVWGEQTVLTFEGEEAQEHLAAFESLARQLTGVQGELTSCDYVIDLPVGVRNGNESYGGLCAYRDGDTVRKAMSCYDEMVGHAEAVAVEDATKEDLANFVYENCYGG